MKIFGQIIGALVETVKLPVAIVKDVVHFVDGEQLTETGEQMDRIKEAAKEGGDE